MASNKKEISNLENELSQKDRLIEEMMNEFQPDQNQQSLNHKISESHLVINLKKQYKELKKENERLQKENENVKKNIKNTKLNEITNENIVLNEQIEKFKILYEHLQNQNMSIEQSVHEYNIMKEALSKQDYIILNFQENLTKKDEEIKTLTNHINTITKQKDDKTEIITKLKQKLKYQYQVNEKLTQRKDNIKGSDVYISMKNNYEKSLQKLRKDLAFYKDSNAKNEKIIRDLKSHNTNRNNNHNNLNETHSYSRSIISSSNPNPRVQNDSGEQNAKMMLLQSKYLEEKGEKEKLQKTVLDLEDQLSKARKTETKVILTNEFNHEVKTPITITDYEYFNDFAMNEFVYILLKNLEANKIDMSIIESRVLTDENLTLLSSQDTYKEFISTTANSLIDILNIQQEKDQRDVHSFIKTFLYSNYISNKHADKAKNPNEFRNKMLSLFDNINFYALEQKQELNRILAIKIQPIKEEMIKLFHYFDENDVGYITFTTLKKVMEETKLKFKNDALEYFIYIMKDFNEEDRFLNELKYENLLKIIDEIHLDPNENIHDDDEEGIGKEKEDGAIEITNEEYLNKVKEIIEKMCKVLKKTHKNLDDYFLKAISKSIKDYKAIQLISVVDILKHEFNIELSHLEIFCLFTKIKPGDSMSKEEDDNNIEEIIDYDKLKREVNEYMKNNEIKDDDDKVDTTKKVKKSNNNNMSNKKEGSFLPQTNKRMNNDLRRSEENYKTRLTYSEAMEKSKQSKEKEDSDNPKDLLNTHMKINKISFERFVFPVHCMMKLSTNGKKFNRFLDVEIFRHLLIQNSVLIYTDALMKFLNSDKLLFNEGRVNIDYLKFILSGQKGIRDNKVNDFMMYKEYQGTFKGKGELAEEKEGSEKRKKLQEEMFGDDGDEIEEIKKNNDDINFI